MLDFTLKKIDCIACEKLKMQGIKLTMRQKKSRDFFWYCSSSTFLKTVASQDFFLIYF